MRRLLRGQALHDPAGETPRYGAIGFIFTGGPNSVYEAGAPKADPAIFELGVSVLGICYGCQFMAHTLGGQVTEAHEDTAREYGKTETYFDSACKLFKGLPAQGITWMSHGDYMEKVPEGFALVAHSDACPNVAICDEAAASTASSTTRRSIIRSMAPT